MNREDMMLGPEPRKASGTVCTVLLAVTTTLGVASCDLPGAAAASVRTVDAAALTTAPAGAVTWCAGRDTTGALLALTDTYNAQAGPDHRLELRELPGRPDRWHDQLAERHRSGSAECDVLGADPTWIAEFAANRWIYDLGPYLSTRRSGYLPSTLPAGRYADRDWAVPFIADVGLLYYRADQVATVPTTWQQVYADAAGASGLVYPGSPGEGLTAVFTEVAYAAGGQILTADGRRSVIDSPENLAALRLLVGGLRDGTAPRAVQTYTEEPARRAFEAGQATFHRDWTSAWASANAAPAIRDDVAVMALPRFDGGRRGGVLGGVSLLLSAYSDNPAAALRAIDWLASADGQRIAALRGLAPTRAALYDDPLVREAVPHHEALRLGIAAARPRPVTPAYRRVSEVIAVNVSNALARRAAPEDALAEAQHQIDQALRGAGRG
nr:extracellular solute-binding protein [Micromonospora sp. DSM 115978]